MCSDIFMWCLTVVNFVFIQAWIKEKEPLLQSTNYGNNLFEVQKLQKKLQVMGNLRCFFFILSDWAINSFLHILCDYFCCNLNKPSTAESYYIDNLRHKWPVSVSKISFCGKSYFVGTLPKLWTLLPTRLLFTAKRDLTYGASSLAPISFDNQPCVKQT